MEHKFKSLSLGHFINDGGEKFFLIYSHSNCKEKLYNSQVVDPIPEMVLLGFFYLRNEAIVNGIQG